MKVPEELEDKWRHKAQEELKKLFYPDPSEEIGFMHGYLAAKEDDYAEMEGIKIEREQFKMEGSHWFNESKKRDELIREFLKVINESSYDVIDLDNFSQELIEKARQIIGDDK